MTGEISYFAKVANDVLKTSEQIATALEDGISVMMSGELSKQASSRPSATETLEDDFDEDFVDASEMMGSPLDGIASGVLGEIMSSQVSRSIRIRRRL